MPSPNGKSKPPAFPWPDAPHSIDAEEGLLGRLIFHAAAYMPDLAFLQAQDFYIIRNAWVFEAIRRVHDRGDDVDTVTICAELAAQKHIEEIGGAAYLTMLLNHSNPIGDPLTYARIVEGTAFRRRMIDTASFIARLAHEESRPITDVKAEAVQAVLTLADGKASAQEHTLADCLSQSYDDLCVRLKQQAEGKLSGLPSGLTELDNLTGGFQKSDLITVAGRPGSGKTSLLLGFALKAARAGAKVGFISMEMSGLQITKRLIAHEVEISTDKQNRAALDDREWALYVEAVDRLSKLPIYINDGSSLTPADIRAQAFRWHNKYKLDLLLIDYVGLIRVPTIREENANARVSAISAAHKALAREFNIPVIQAAQMNRNIEGRREKRPMLSDLRDSGSLEQDSDIVLFVHREEMFDQDTTRPNQADLIIEKHRNGPTGTVTAYFRKDLTKFDNLKRTPIDLAGFNQAFQPPAVRGAKDDAR